jgi:hypothetical protein
MTSDIKHVARSQGARFGGHIKAQDVSSATVDTSKLGPKVNKYEAEQHKAIQNAAFGDTYDAIMRRATEGEVDPTRQAMEAAKRQYFSWSSVMFATFAGIATGMLIATIVIGVMSGSTLPSFNSNEMPLNVGILVLSYGLTSIYAVYGSKDHTKRCSATKWRKGDAEVVAGNAKEGEPRSEKKFQGRLCHSDDDCSLYNNPPKGICRVPRAAVGYPIHMYRSGVVPAALLGGIVTVLVTMTSYDYRPSKLHLAQLIMMGIGAAYIGAATFSWTTL